MKNATVVSIVLAVSVLIAIPAQAQRMGRGFSSRSHVGGSHASKGFGQLSRFHGHSSLRFGSPHSHHHRFGHRHRFGHHHKFSHHRHLHHKHFFPPYYYQAPGGFAFYSFGIPFGFGIYSYGFSHRSFSSLDTFGPAGPPPLGAPGPSPLGATRSFPVVINSPFFCFPHRLSFADQAVFVDHLHTFHRLPLRSALSFCRPVGGGTRLIFFGF
jgi:hypothetical protein